MMVNKLVLSSERRIKLDISRIQSKLLSKVSFVQEILLRSKILKKYYCFYQFGVASNLRKLKTFDQYLKALIMRTI
jgi:hypothetical protein